MFPFELFLAKWPGTITTTAVEIIAEDATVTGPKEETEAQEETREKVKGATETVTTRTRAKSQSRKP